MNLMKNQLLDRRKTLKQNVEQEEKTRENPLPISYQDNLLRGVSEEDANPRKDLPMRVPMSANEMPLKEKLTKRDANPIIDTLIGFSFSGISLSLW